MAVGTGRKTVELGQRIQPGQSLLAIVPVDDIWVTADFKETQLKYMRPGQSVNIHVDTFGRDYRGAVENLPGAAGTLFSLLPPENASGNFVKVVQRLPCGFVSIPTRILSICYGPVCRSNLRSKCDDSYRILERQYQRLTNRNFQITKGEI